MNNIVAMYHALRNVVAFDDLVNILFQEYGMPRRKSYPDGLGLIDRCEMLAKDWVRYQYAKNLRERASVPDAELNGSIICTALQFYAIIKAGNVKPLYLITADASDFIRSTAFTQILEPQYFIDNFKAPLVLYSGEPKTLFDDVQCIEMLYNEEERTLECLLSCVAEGLPSREFSRQIPIEELKGVFTKDILAMDELGDSTLYMLQQGFINAVDDLNNRFFEAIRYALKFKLLMESDKQPLVSEMLHRKGGNAQKRDQLFGKLNQQRISLTTVYRQVIRQNGGPEKLVLDKEGKTLKAIKVRGYLRRQHYGPGNSLVKTVFIDAHDSQAWKNSGIRIIQVVK